MKRFFVLAGLCLLGTGCSMTIDHRINAHTETLQALATKHKAACHAAADKQQQQFVIGYGSLMQAASRLRTAPNADTAYAVEVSGYRRGWFASGSSIGFSTTFLGAVPDQDNGFNAVMFAISPEELLAMDQRESGYCRSAVDTGKLHLVGKGAELPAGQYWIYSNTTNSIALPDKKKPLVQSYVDIFIGGCMEQEEAYNIAGFAERCISSTSDWSAHWVNDRLYPRRPFIHQPRAGQIDRLLDQALPELFRQVAIE